MGMKVNAELPLPADLKAEYPMPEKSKEIKKERHQQIRDILPGNQISLLFWLVHARQITKIPSANT